MLVHTNVFVIPVTACGLLWVESNKWIGFLCCLVLTAGNLVIKRSRKKIKTLDIKFYFSVSLNWLLRELYITFQMFINCGHREKKIKITTSTFCQQIEIFLGRVKVVGMCVGWSEAWQKLVSWYLHANIYILKNNLIIERFVDTK